MQCMQEQIVCTQVSHYDEYIFCQNDVNAAFEFYQCPQNLIVASQNHVMTYISIDFNVCVSDGSGMFVERD